MLSEQRIRNVYCLLRMSRSKPFDWADEDYGEENTSPLLGNGRILSTTALLLCINMKHIPSLKNGACIV